jgi:CheY-like chemotaxis protein
MGRQVSILAVDDHEPNLLAVRIILQGLGSIVSALSGEEALRRLLHQDFDIILLDVVMPNMDGIETAGLIRERERTKHTPIIFLTALGNIEERIRSAQNLGEVDCITKPFSPETLRNKVLTLLDLNTHQDTL